MTFYGNTMVPIDKKKDIMDLNTQPNEMDIKNNNIKLKKSHTLKINKLNKCISLGNENNNQNPDNKENKGIYNNKMSLFGIKSKVNTGKICFSEAGNKIKLKDELIDKNEIDKFNKTSGNDDSKVRNLIDDEDQSYNSFFNNDFEIINKKEEFDKGIRIKNFGKFRNKKKKEMYKLMEKEEKEKKNQKKEGGKYVVYIYKEYDEKDLSELEFEKAIIHDKRFFCQMFFYNLRQKQMIINTFCEKEQLKPFSIKLLVMVFNFSCYSIINGFFYTEEYIGKLYKNEIVTTLDYIKDSIERIIYASLAGGIMSFIIGLLLETDKKINEAIEKGKRNKILLRGEISKIYRRYKIILLIFIVFQFIAMTFFTLYAFSFCYVYPNTKMDWLKSNIVVIGFVQFVSIFECFLMALARYLSVKFRWEFCFKFNAYLEDNL